MEIYGIIYKTIFPNGKIYIGQTIRFNERYFGSGKQVSRAIKKYGKDQIKRITLKECYSKDELDKWEKIYIIKFKSTDIRIGYNLDKGGFGTGRLSESTKDKIRKSLIGIKHSKERIKNSIENRKGYKHSEETKIKIRSSNKNLKRDDLAKKNISIAQKKRFNGKGISEKTKLKMRISQRKRRNTELRLK